MSDVSIAGIIGAVMGSVLTLLVIYLIRMVRDRKRARDGYYVKHVRLLRKQQETPLTPTALAGLSIIDIDREERDELNKERSDEFKKKQAENGE